MFLLAENALLLHCKDRSLMLCREIFAVLRAGCITLAHFVDFVWVKELMPAYSDHCG